MEDLGPIDCHAPGKCDDRPLYGYPVFQTNPCFFCLAGANIMNHLGISSMFMLEGSIVLSKFGKLGEAAGLYHVCLNVCFMAYVVLEISFVSCVSCFFR